jgi:8-oxo-dGTP diphosphatase
MVGLLGEFGDTAHRVDSFQKRRELDRPVQGARGAFPPREIGERGINLFVRQHSHGIDGIPSSAMHEQIVVAGALISHDALLVAQRERPAELAGLWELPGGKAAAGESDAEALARELHEELAIRVRVGARIGPEVTLPNGMTMRAYRVTLTDGSPQPHDHRALRWVSAAELDDLPWVPADRAWVPDLLAALGAPDRQ